MVKYPLADLLSARLFREEAAERLVIRAAAELEQAEAAALEARRLLEEYRAWRPGEEKRLFDEEVKLRIISLGDLDSHQEDIQKLRVAELKKEEAAVAAEKQVALAHEALVQARKGLETAVRERRKIDEHRDRWLKEEAVKRDRAEEAELEDFPSPSALAASESEVAESSGGVE